LNDGVGEIDLNYMRKIYKTSGSFPAPTWKETKRIYRKTGGWGKISTGHPSNALVAIMKPSEGIYSLCIGPAKRGLTPNSTHWAGINPIYNETNCFWEIKLKQSPNEMLQNATDIGIQDVEKAKAQLNMIDKSHENYAYLNLLMEEVEKEIKIAKKIKIEGNISNNNNYVYKVAKALRAATKAQVRARQICDLIEVS
jgi:hypothetical protein